jgi:hemoglobin
METLTAQHIEQLVHRFYAKVRKDPLLGPVFNDVAKVDWDHHLPLLCQFWNSVMFGKREYYGDPYTKHMLLASKTELSEAHFARWLELFNDTADAILPTDAAQEIQYRAMMIAGALKRGMLGHAKH